ncbi:hypothetical protein [Halopseudomonas sp.]|uniref:hypothetical protein n=1 Tax=Halopseudomonas sp. TaxID=2901191 RepID=UPI00356617C8
MNNMTRIAAMCLLGLMASVSQAADMASDDGMMKDDMKKSMDHQKMMNDDMPDATEPDMEHKGMVMEDTMKDSMDKKMDDDMDHEDMQKSDSMN